MSAFLVFTTLIKLSQRILRAWVHSIETVDWRNKFTKSTGHHA
jgi:hypothetical protein